MDLEKALEIVNAKCDVDLPTLTQIFRDATQQKFGEREARGLLLSNRTAAIVKDEYNRILAEKGRQYLQQYSVILPTVETVDFTALERRLRTHFRGKLDFVFSEACHQLDVVKEKLRTQNGALIHLDVDYQNSLRGWEADIQILVAYLEKTKMSAQPNITYHFHGHNARVNTNSVDASVNVVNLSEGQLFGDLRKALAAIPDETVRERLIEQTKQLEAQKERPGRMSAYLKFVEHVANHVTLISPLLPALAQWAQQ